MPFARRLLPALFGAPLLLALAACGSNETGDAAALASEPIAPIAAPAGTNWTQTVTVTELKGHLLGNPDAPIKLVEYASLTCPTCARFGMEGIEPLVQNYVSTGVVSYELRNFPVHGVIDIVLARLVRCGPPEAVHPLSEQVWKNEQAITGPVQANAAQIEQAMQLPMDQRFVAFAQLGGFFDFFAQRGLSEDKARQCLADVPAIEDLANTAQAQQQEFSLTGTPAFFLNGRMLEGVLTWAELEPLLQRAGARKE